MAHLLSVCPVYHDARLQIEQKKQEIRNALAKKTIASAKRRAERKRKHRLKKASLQYQKQKKLLQKKLVQKRLVDSLTHMNPHTHGQTNAHTANSSRRMTRFKRGSSKNRQQLEREAVKNRVRRLHQRSQTDVNNFRDDKKEEQLSLRSTRVGIEKDKKKEKRNGRTMTNIQPEKKKTFTDISSLPLNNEGFRVTEHIKRLVEDLDSPNVLCFVGKLLNDTSRANDDSSATGTTIGGLDNDDDTGQNKEKENIKSTENQIQAEQEENVYISMDAKELSSEVFNLAWQILYDCAFLLAESSGIPSSVLLLSNYRDVDFNASLGTSLADTSNNTLQNNANVDTLEILLWLEMSPCLGLPLVISRRFQHVFLQTCFSLFSEKIISFSPSSSFSPPSNGVGMLDHYHILSRVLQSFTMQGYDVSKVGKALMYGKSSSIFDRMKSSIVSRKQHYSQAHHKNDELENLIGFTKNSTEQIWQEFYSNDRQSSNAFTNDDRNSKAKGTKGKVDEVREEEENFQNDDEWLLL
eukprot:g3789.t1